MPFLTPEYQNLFEKTFAQGWIQHPKGAFILQSFREDLLHVFISLTTIADKGEKILGLIITNLSEQKELERLTQTKEELSQKNAELLRINNELDTFVYIESFIFF